MSEIGAGERSARRTLVMNSALLVVIVVIVHLVFVARGEFGEFPVWSVALTWFAAGSTLVAGIVARRVPDSTLRVLALVSVIAYWTTLVTFAASVPAQGIDRIPWTLSASGAAAAAALVAGGRRLAWSTVIVGAAAGLVYRTVFGGLDLDGVVNDLQALLTGAVICVIGGHILAVGRGLDTAAAAATAAAARESSERGRFAARSRAATLVHDEVLATLAFAASELPIPPARLAAQARKAVSMVTRLADEEAEEPTVLRTALAIEARSHGAIFTVRGNSSLASSAAMDEAFIGAARQALSNSVRHAPDALREVVLVRTAAEIRVEIVDDGPGFDVALIPDDRLGIRQSIVGRMSRMTGASAEVTSVPGGGTSVHLRYVAPSPKELAESGGDNSLRAGVAIIAVVYVIIQVLCAALAVIATPRSWPLQLAMLVGALLAAEVLRGSPARVPSPLRTTLVVALACAGTIAGPATAHFVYGMPYSYGTVWFVVAFAFLFVTLALRGRIRVALAATGVIVGVLVATGIVANAPAGQIVQSTVRPVVIVGLAVALILLVERMESRIADLHRDGVASTARESWTLGARSELTARVAELVRTVVPLLARIGEGREPTESQRREYAGCEGELRDALRAGALARDPLLTVVAAARERGVDVLLLDDSSGDLDDLLTDSILSWMAAAVAPAHSRVTGRLLPPGRQAQASVTVDGLHTEFAVVPPDHGAVMSFQGE